MLRRSAPVWISWALFIVVWIWFWSQARALRRTEPVVVAGRDVAAGEALTAFNAVLADWPAGVDLPGRVTSVADVLGKRLRHAVARGEPLLLSHLGDQPPGAGERWRLGRSEFALAVPVSLVEAVGGGVQVGDRVAVLYYFGLPGFSTRNASARGEEGQAGAGQTLIPAAEVLDVRNGRGEPLTSLAVAKSGEARLPASVTLRLSEADALRLVPVLAAVARGTGVLMLAAVGDETGGGGS